MGSVGVRMVLTLRGGVCRGKWREDRVEWLHYLLRGYIVVIAYAIVQSLSFWVP